MKLLLCVLQVILSPDKHILLNADLKKSRPNETIDIHYLDSGGTTFSFVTCISFPAPTDRESYLLFEPELAFSADGSKFAMAMSEGGPGVSVWDIQSKTPFKIVMEVPKYGDSRLVCNLQFSSGKSGKEVLVFVEVCPMFTF